MTPSPSQIEHFIREGYLRVDDAFPGELARSCRELLWHEMGLSPSDPAGWTRPVIRLGDNAHPSFRAAANAPALHAAFDALVGAGRWLAPGGLGTFPVRFPSGEIPDDCGWHVDPSFGWEATPSFMDWRLNLASKGRALLMLFLLSDVGDDDAPTRLRAGSHLDIARRLAPHGDAGLTLGELASTGFAESAHRREVVATGAAGTVYLCHPFLVHSAQPHRGRAPRFLAQPPLLPAVPFDPEAGSSPVERAIALGVAGSG